MHRDESSSHDVDTARVYYNDFIKTLRATLKKSNPLGWDDFTADTVIGTTLHTKLYNLENFNVLQTCLLWKDKPYTVDMDVSRIPLNSSKASGKCSSGIMCYVTLSWKRSKFARYKLLLSSSLELIGLTVAATVLIVLLAVVVYYAMYYVNARALATLQTAASRVLSIVNSIVSPHAAAAANATRTAANTTPTVVV